MHTSARPRSSSEGFIVAVKSVSMPPAEQQRGPPRCRGYSVCTREQPKQVSITVMKVSSKEMNTESSKGSSKVCGRENSEGSSNGNNTESAACVSRPSTVIRGFFF